MTRLGRLRTTGLALCSALALAGAVLTAGAVTAAPASASTCSPKLDMNVGFSGVLDSADHATASSAASADAPSGWINTCQSGVVYEKWSGSDNMFGCPYVIIFDVYMGCVPPDPGPYGVYTIRSPYAPYHRIWLHADVDGAGWSACFYSKDNDITIPQQYDNPGNVQVSANTSPC
jgi:hypothetical protein